jgi:hypothetical protein
MNAIIQSPYSALDHALDAALASLLTAEQRESVTRCHGRWTTAVRGLLLAAAEADCDGADDERESFWQAAERTAHDGALWIALAGRV